jgi:DNA invertase Pin-like site-specific DNA recombinase
MKPEARKASLRCAIYTRVSSDSGLEQEFNSLDNQREASEAYVKSQAHEGWKLIRDRYDDGGFSGGSIERPALQKLLEDVKRGRVDVIVVYKVDRLTRSLADFAKLVELFDARGVSFVSVTQAFNTTTSMGRLTLNMLLSFAQFEREVTGERIRDKIAASKKKGIWMGGVVPLGYRVENRALHVVEEHAALVREIFRRYLDFGAVVPLKAALDSENVRLPERIDGTGKRTGGGLISRGHLHKILSNPIYVGRLPHKGRVYDGQHKAIIDAETWDRVQALLASHTRSRNGPTRSTVALLAGKLYDDRGHRMSPSEVSRGSRRWRYYVSQAVLQGRKREAGSIPRLAAVEIEDKVLEAARSAVGAEADSLSSQGICDSLERVAIGRAGLTIELNHRLPAADGSKIIQLSWTPRSPRRRREIVQGDGSRQAALRPMRSEARGRFAIGFRDARHWLDQLIAGPAISIASIAAREKRTERSIRQILSLAFLDPALVEAALQGHLPRGFGLKRLLDLPVAWPEQWTRLGLKAPARP